MGGALMARADVTLSLPLGDDGEATQADAEALAQMIQTIINDSPASALGLRCAVTRVELVEGNRLGRTGAANLLEQMREGGR